MTQSRMMMDNDNFMICNKYAFTTTNNIGLIIIIIIIMQTATFNHSTTITTGTYRDAFDDTDHPNVIEATHWSNAMAPVMTTGKQPQKHWRNVSSNSSDGSSDGDRS
jgi:hypothetical protein